MEVNQLEEFLSKVNDDKLENMYDSDHCEIKNDDNNDNINDDDDDNDDNDEKFHHDDKYDNIQNNINVEKEILKTTNQTNNVKDISIDISTEGIDETKIKNINLKYVKIIKQCHYCGKYFNKNLIIKNEDGQQCKHCLFWLNYDENTRLEFDKKCIKQGFCIAEYILDCHKEHNTDNCTRKINGGGCLLCDFKMGIPILNIMNSNILQKQNDTNEHVSFYEDVLLEEEHKTKFKIPTKLIL